MILYLFGSVASFALCLFAFYITGKAITKCSFVASVVYSLFSVASAIFTLCGLFAYFVIYYIDRK